LNDPAAHAWQRSTAWPVASPLMVLVGSATGSVPGVHRHCRPNVEPTLAVVIPSPQAVHVPLEAVDFQNPTGHGRGADGATDDDDPSSRRRREPGAG
jgi:hypothetical protein